MEEEQKEGAPAWMVSFGDMMTLILTFFILLVSMSKEQQEGLVAKGVGSFLVSIRSFGLPGLLDNTEEASIFESVRQRFNLPPEANPERREEYLEASRLEQIRAKAAQALKPHHEMNQPGVAVFRPGSAELTPEARRFIDLTASTLRPGRGQILLLEGHASKESGVGDDRLLAYRRARAVADYLIEEHEFLPTRVEARAWLSEIDPPGAGTRGVDARLVIPGE